jgi:hypothetical protein
MFKTAKTLGFYKNLGAFVPWWLKPAFTLFDESSRPSSAPAQPSSPEN